VRSCRSLWIDSDQGIFCKVTVLYMVHVWAAVQWRLCMTTMAAVVAPGQQTPAQEMATRLRWMNGGEKPTLQDEQHASTAPARILGRKARNTTHAWTGCTPCSFNTLQQYATLQDSDFHESNAWRAVVYCGGGAPTLGGCWSHDDGVNTILAAVTIMNANFILKHGRPYTNARCRFYCYVRWCQQYMPGSRAGAEQPPLPVCVIARFRGTFQEPLSVSYGGRGTWAKPCSMTYHSIFAFNYNKHSLRLLV